MEHKVNESNMEVSVYEMKIALENYGWDWNVLDLMEDEEIIDKYEEMDNLED